FVHCANAEEHVSITIANRTAIFIRASCRNSPPRRGGDASEASGVVRPAEKFGRTDHPGLRPPLLCEEGNVRAIKSQMPDDVFETMRGFVVAHIRRKRERLTDRNPNGTAARPRVMDGVDLVESRKSDGHDRHAEADSHHADSRTKRM